MAHRYFDDDIATTAPQHTRAGQASCSYIAISLYETIDTVWLNKADLKYLLKQLEEFDERNNKSV